MSAALVDTAVAVPKYADELPSSKSASNPDPAPSTVLIAVNISDAVWSPFAPDSIPSNLALSSSVIAPHVVGVAAGILALLPSDELTTNAVLDALVDKSVDTLLTLLLLVAIAVACGPDIVVGFPDKSE